MQQSTVPVAYVRLTNRLDTDPLGHATSQFNFITQH